MRVLVSGGAGFIGSHVVGALAARGAECWVLDNLETGLRENVPAGARLIEGDVRRPADVEAAFAEARPEAVVHLAALVSVAISITEPLRCWETNVTGTRHLLEASVRHGAKRFAYASSAAVYGDEPSLPKTEASPVRPMTPYAESKLQNERDAAYFSSYLGLETVGLRFFNVYGPRQRPDSPYSGVISILLAALQGGGRFVRYGDGGQTRDFVYVGDVADAVAAAALNPPPARHAVFNVGRGVRESINALIESAERVSGRRLALAEAACRRGDIRHSLSNPAALASAYGLQARVDLDAGLERTLAWLEEGAALSG